MAVLQVLLESLHFEFLWVALCVHMDSCLNGKRRLIAIYKTLGDSDG